MGIGWAIVAFFFPGVPQILHLDIIKALLIWFLPGIALAGIIPLGGIIAIAMGLIIFLYNLSTAMEY